jgi:hypothetical protein
LYKIYKNIMDFNREEEKNITSPVSPPFLKSKVV